MSDLLEFAAAKYEEQFGKSPEAAAYAPGRVEILGNHTDYNGGYVMAAAIDKGTVLVGGQLGDGEISLHAIDLNRSASFNYSSFTRDSRNSWANYVLGVVQQLKNADIEGGGFTAAISSRIPMGAGLSSSAAMEVATTFLLKQLYPFDLERMEIAKLCQRAENQFVGVSSGLLDQFSSTFGAPDNLLFLDCVTFEHEQLALPRTDLSLVICNSESSHSLTGGDYNTRYGECMAAAAFFGKKLLRDVTIEEFNAKKAELPENQSKRAQHIIEENGRVLEARAALKAGDSALLGQLMTRSHMSSRYLFENSTQELDFLVDTAIELPGCLGSRLTGGGWGGATVSLVENEHVDSFTLSLVEAYTAHAGKVPRVFVSAISDGAHILPI